MIYGGLILYGLLLLILLLFWRKTRGLSSDDLLAQSARDHHRVQGVIVKHPRGGSWKEHRKWMEAEKEKPRRRRRRN